MEINYLINDATAKDIIEHLNSCDSYFIPPLSTRVNLIEYSDKIRKFGITFECWNYEKKLVGLVAVYMNDNVNNNGFISNVSVISNYRNKGIAKFLIDNCLSYAKKNSINCLTLEVSELNIRAIKLYKTFGFQITKKNGIFLEMKLNV